MHINSFIRCRVFCLYTEGLLRGERLSQHLPDFHHVGIERALAFRYHFLQLPLHPCSTLHGFKKSLHLFLLFRYSFHLRQLLSLISLTFPMWIIHMGAVLFKFQLKRG